MDVETEATIETPKRLRFNETLSWRAGRAIPVAELSKRLQELASELRDTEQEHLERESFLTPAKELASTNILAHKDRGIRAHAACCLVDILRLCAPEAPFTASQLKDIFTLFVTSIIPILGDTSNPYNAQHLYVLQSLAQVKSVILITDVPSSNDLIRRLLLSCFDILSTSGNRLSKNVEYNMTGMLECIIDESPNLPPDIIDTILAQFLRADPGFGVSNADAASGLSHHQNLEHWHLPASYNMAKNICNTCTERMSRYCSQYFSTVIMDSSVFGSNHKDIGHDTEMGLVPSDADLKELQKAHRLLRELWRACPLILQNVIPQIEAELQATHESLRLIATEAIGDLIAGIGAAGMPQRVVPDLLAWPPVNLLDAPGSQLPGPSPLPFDQYHPTAYKSFLSRRNDKSASIRAIWTTCIGRILSSSTISSPEKTTILAFLSTVLQDSDEKVRIAAIRAIGDLPFRDVVFSVGSLGPISQEGSIMNRLAERVKDKRSPVRAEAIPLLGRLWASACGDIINSNATVIDVLGSIPSRVLDAYYTNDPDIQNQIDHILFDFLIPIGFPIPKTRQKSQASADEDHASEAKALSDAEADLLRAERILLLAHSLEGRSRAVLNVLLSRPARLMKFIQALIQRFEDFNGGIMDKDEASIKSSMHKLIDVFAKSFPDADRVTIDLQKFAKMHDRRCYSLMRFCTSVDSDYRKVQKALRELRRRLDTSALASTTAPDTVMMLVQKSSHLFFNKSHVAPIIAISQDPSSPLTGTAHELLKEISSAAPAILETHAGEMCRTLQAQAPSHGETLSSGIIDTLKACAMFAKHMPTNIPRDKKFTQAMVQYAVKGNPPQAAKHAVSILMAISEKKRDVQIRQLLRLCTENFRYGESSYLSKLACLSQLMLLASRDLDNEDCDPVTDIAIVQVLQRKEQSLERGRVNDVEWSEDLDDDCQAKLWAVKILVNRLRAFDDASSVAGVAQPVYTLLSKIIADDGEIPKSSPSPKAHRSAMRLQASKCLLKLSSRKSFDPLLTPAAFNKLAEMAQDPLFAVRKRFLEKVMKYLVADRLPSRFHVFIYLTAFEPSEKLRNDCSTWLRARATSLAQRNKSTMEVSIARFLSVLAHHPDFGMETTDLEDFITYIMHYLKAVASEDNIHLIYHVVQRVKSVQDGIDPSKSEALYCLSDLTQAMIRQYVEQKDWTLQAYGGKVSLPSGVFQTMPSHEQAQRVAETKYLPDGMEEIIESAVKAGLKLKKRKAEYLADIRRTKRRGPSSTPNGHARSLLSKSKKKQRQHSESIQSSSPMSAIHDRRRSTRNSGVRPTYLENSDQSDRSEDELDTTLNQKSRPPRRGKTGTNIREASEEDNKSEDHDMDESNEKENESTKDDKRTVGAASSEQSLKQQATSSGGTRTRSKRVKS